VLTNCFLSEITTVDNTQNKTGNYQYYIPTNISTEEEEEEESAMI